MSDATANTPIENTNNTVDTAEEMDSEIESLKKENEELRVQSESMRAKLLEANMLANNYLEEMEKLKEQLERITSPPLFIATVMETEDDMALIRQHGNNQEVVTQIPAEFKDEIEPGVRVSINAAFSIVSIMRKATDMRAQIMEVINSPDVDYDMIGGLDDVLNEVIESVEMPLTEPELFDKIGIEPPSGVLMYGDPGTGKTLIAKAVASRAHASFIRMSGSDLVQKFIGEGARLVKDVFQMARDKSPCILFIDEIDAVGGMRTHDGTTGSAEVNRTMLQLLSEMDGFEPRGQVKIIAATNRIDLLDPALLRPGRFDRVIEVPIPDDKAREDILRIHTRHMNLADDVDMTKLAKMANGLSGADLKIIVKEAGMFVLRRRGEQITMKDLTEAFNKVTTEEEQNTSSGMFA
ncbi:proteasome-activating nucleotidase [Methanohalophilus portucalensis]|uniref:AAA family ATPase n=2 Tax=Methanohalophilus portucalensis TaxID=39664 RepID=A0A1L9C662_9EURY|nr:proteasome-activating nucleotidase [Methanohalophilus portucalensis]ATU08585.1 peptidase [Methanohalophilus portucalensis]OJH49956.1 proteasome-activating nucleotidase [Methanohalophilus portucalensis FDF-1]RNI13241.1 AAA family ATPase [Methanohalophilus portucalensis FDF-1]SMH32557.1 Proteasome-activating nucleotidase [Methanohalophilus portucalensis FDF-1]